jgi:hypothetical protein
MAIPLASMAERRTGIEWPARKRALRRRRAESRREQIE